MKTGIVTALALGLGSTAWAAGFQVDTQSARPTGMATAVVASIDDASAVLYNAAGMAHNEGLDLQFGDTLIIPSASFTPSGGGTSTGSVTGVLPPPHLYLTYGTKNAAVGIGIYSLFGLATDWPATWPGRYLAVNSSLTTYDINPGFAVRLGDRVRLGAGFDVIRGVVQISRAINFVDGDGQVELGGGAWGVSENFGVQIDVLPKMLSIGASYRFPTGLPFSGNAHFSGQPAELAGTLKDQAITSSVTLPDYLQVGVAVHPIEPLLVELDAAWTDWATFQSLDVNFTDPTLSSSLRKSWKSVWNFHLGAEYAITEALRVRLGLLYDPTPSPQDTLSPDLPDANRINISAGVGYRVTNWFQADLGYQFVVLLASTSTDTALPGTYSGDAQVIGLSLTFRM